MKSIIRTTFILVICILATACGRHRNYSLSEWPEGFTPQETGLRLEEKYLETPHKSSGDVSSSDDPTQITYSEACTWLGSLWFADVTDNADLLARLDEQLYGAAARKGWLSLVGYINDEDNVTEICEGTGTSSNRSHYMNRKRNTGDFHGQAPMLWCAAALLR